MKKDNMTEFGKPLDEASSIVLNILKPSEEVFWGARKKGITVV